MHYEIKFGAKYRKGIGSPPKSNPLFNGSRPTSPKIHQNPFVSILDILHTERHTQTDRHTDQYDNITSTAEVMN